MLKKSYYNIEVETLDNGDILLYNSRKCPTTRRIDKNSKI